MWGEVLNITTTLWPAARTTIRHAAHYLISTNYKDQTRFSLSEGVMSRGQGRGVGPLRQDCWYSVKTPWDNFQPRQPQLAVGSHLTPHSGPVSLVTCSTSEDWAVARSSLSQSLFVRSYLIPADFNCCRRELLETSRQMVLGPPSPTSHLPPPHTAQPSALSVLSCKTFPPTVLIRTLAARLIFWNKAANWVCVSSCKLVQMITTVARLIVSRCNLNHFMSHNW